MPDGATSHSSFAAVAKLIVPHGPPVWLADALANWGIQIAEEQKAQKDVPFKSEFRRRLLETKDYAEGIVRFLNDPYAMVFVEAESTTRIENTTNFEISLLQFAEALRAAASSHTVAASNGTTTKRGRGKALPSTALSPKTHCALVIAEIWLVLRGRHPAPRNEEAALAAQAYWRACGGLVKPWGSKPETSWSYHFREARLPTTEALRAEVNRHCIDRAEQPS